MHASEHLDGVENWQRNQPGVATDTAGAHAAGLTEYPNASGRILVTDAKKMLVEQLTTRVSESGLRNGSR